MRIFFLLFGFILLARMVSAQDSYWQQAVNYYMDVNLDVNSHRFTGSQRLVYTNNSPDTLRRVFYHLYFNAFQPGSMMDVRSRTIADPDGRVRDRISKLKPEEEGRLLPVNLFQDRMPVSYQVQGTILEVTLHHPILPHSSAVFDMAFEGQVPLQIRRSGRDNKEGIAYSMSQWYPKICAYDRHGWHPEPYVAREFYGTWGRFDVHITLDAAYIVAASGKLLGVNETEMTGKRRSRKAPALKTWHFVADNVHDFMWAADPDYVHKTVQVPDGPLMHFFYVEDSITTESWPQLMAIAPRMVQFLSRQFGKYPYDDFYVIQGGDGGMEYPMSTLITGRRKARSLIGVTLHEMLHSWYQGVLATNESLYAWMDEGFTSYAQAVTSAYLFDEDPNWERSYKGYLSLVKSGLQEPLTTHADHFNTNVAYGIGSYTMGSLVPYQLAYIMGDEVFAAAFRDYFYTWQFRHPEPADFLRIMEKHSGMVLDWFLLDWIGTTKHLDYAITKVEASGDSTLVHLANKNQRPMPVEMLVTYQDGSKERYYLPLLMMFGRKQFADDIPTTTLDPWPWTHPERTVVVPKAKEQIKEIKLDPDMGTLDIDYSNNTWPSTDK